MADDFIEIDLGGTLRDLRRAERRLSNLRPLMATLAETMLSGVQDNFRRQEGPGGQPWEALTEDYADKMRRTGKTPEPTLRRSQGGLYASLQPFSSRTEAGVGVAKRYAAVHQLGGKPSMAPGPAAIEARPYLYLSQETEREMTDDIDHYLREAGV